jgi:hypothetical protein
MEAARTSTTSVDNYFTPQYIPEDKSELNLTEFTVVNNLAAMVTMEHKKSKPTV